MYFHAVHFLPPPPLSLFIQFHSSINLFTNSTFVKMWSSLLLLGSYVKSRLLESYSSPGSWNSPTVRHKQTNRFGVFLTDGKREECWERTQPMLRRRRVYRFEETTSVEETDHGSFHRRECIHRHRVQCHLSEAKPNDRTRTESQHLIGSSGLRLPQIMDQDPPESRNRHHTFHTPREHHRSDLCCCLLQHRSCRFFSLPKVKIMIQWYECINLTSIKFHCVGGFASYLLGLNRRTYELTGVNTQGNNPRGIKEPGVGWMTSFLFVTSFIGLVVLVPLRKVISDFLRSYVDLKARVLIMKWYVN